MNLASIVAANAAANASKPAIICGDEEISYAEFVDLIAVFSKQLAGQGISASDRVGLSMGDHPNHIIAHFAVAQLGGVIVPIDHRWTDTEKIAATKAFDVKLIVTDGDRIAGAQTIALDRAADTCIDSIDPITKSLPMDLLVSLSSGTTGKPTGALVTHENLHERFISQWKTIGYSTEDCFAILTPLFFGAGRSFAMSLLVAGGTVLLAPPPLKPNEMLDVLQDERITATFLPPTLLRRLLPFHKDDSPPLLKHIQYLVVSGEPLYAEEALLCMQKICPNIYSYYASSEGGGISVMPPADFEQFASTVGLPTHKTEVQIVDSQDKLLDRNQVGRLRYRGPGVALRYLDADGAENDAGNNGWFYPGDLAEIDASGHISLRGRDKDVLIRGGVNIYPAEIESHLQQHPAIKECAVIGVDDAGFGQSVIACISLNAEIPDEDLLAFCRQSLAPYKIPSRFVRLSDLPRRSSGKIDKGILAREIS